ncbi:MAG: hypothetical protein QOH28_1311 [Actinomycetota bacterium]|nr:hypothetical protein [Actinomycetota bacterium]
MRHEWRELGKGGPSDLPRQGPHAYDPPMATMMHQPSNFGSKTQVLASGRDTRFVASIGSKNPQGSDDARGRTARRKPTTSLCTCGDYRRRASVGEHAPLPG